MPELNGIHALKTIYEQYPAVRVLALSAYLDEIHVGQCLEFGINGYLTKNMDIDDVVKAIYTAHDNEVYTSNIINNALIKMYLSKYSKNNHNLLPQFSEQEIAILHLLKQGKNLNDIAEKLFLSKRSIELKLNKMKETANIKSTIALIFHAYHRNLFGE
jgi:DNA-binding NarL/FixJ family response regulator